jgi:inosine-uridine nucleoside N-ribohydrolase
VKELVLMGGSFNPHAANNAFALEYIHHPRLEFNFRWDPEAAAAVLRAPWRKIVQVPVDPSTRTLFTAEMMQRLKAGKSASARYWSRWAESFPLWDEIAAGVWLDPKLATRTEKLSVDVDIGRDGSAYGCTLSWAPGEGPGRGERVVEVVFEVDVPRLNERVVEALSR